MKFITNKYIKKIIALAMFFILIAPATLNADLLNNDKMSEFQNNLDTLAVDTGYGTSDTLEEIIGTVIRIVLAILGSIFLLFMFLAGFKWMRAAGNQETIKKAQSQIKSLTIGLLVILAAYALSYWIVGVFANILAD